MSKRNTNSSNTILNVARYSEVISPATFPSRQAPPPYLIDACDLRYNTPDNLIFIDIP